MQFTKNILAASALVAFVNAAQFTNTDFSGITAGEPFNISWSGATEGVTLLLKNGPSTALTTVSTIVSGATGTSFLWTPATTLADGTYALEIDASGQDPNYSAQFPITGGSGSVVSTTLSGSAASSLSSAVSSAVSSLNATTLTVSATATGFSNSTATTVTATSTGSATQKATGSSSKSATGSSSSSTATSAPNSATAQFGSPIALVMAAFAAIAYLN